MRRVTAKALRDVVEAPGTALFLARVNGRVVGSVTAVVYGIPSGLHAWAEGVVVDSSARGAGVGEALVRAAVAEAGARGAQTIDLTSSPPRGAEIRLHQRVGFRRREKSVFRYTGADEHASS